MPRRGWASDRMTAATDTRAGPGARAGHRARLEPR
jgi:hypothetical protein